MMMLLLCQLSVLSFQISPIAATPIRIHIGSAGSSMPNPQSPSKSHGSLLSFISSCQLLHIASVLMSGFSDGDFKQHFLVMSQLEPGSSTRVLRPKLANRWRAWLKWLCGKRWAFCLSEMRCPLGSGTRQMLF